MAINQKDGSLGMLVHDKSLYNHLDSTIAQLKLLLKDIEKYPRRYTLTLLEKTSSLS